MVLYKLADALAHLHMKSNKMKWSEANQTKPNRNEAYITEKVDDFSCSCIKIAAETINYPSNKALKRIN